MYSIDMGLTVSNNYCKCCENCNGKCNTDPGQKSGGSYKGMDLTIPQNFLHMVGKVPMYTYTIKPTPEDAKVVFEVEGYTQNGNSITVPSGTLIKYTVSKKYYNEKTGVKRVVRTITEPMELDSNYYTFTINPTPEDAVVSLIAEGYIQEGNSITVRPETPIYWSVSYPHYSTKTGITIMEDKDVEENPVLEYLMRTITVYPTPEDAVIKLTATGCVQEGNHIEVPIGDSVMWTVSAPHYISKSGSMVVTDNMDIYVELKENSYLYTLIPDPVDSLVTLRHNDEVISGIGPQSMTVEYGDTVQWEVSKQYYDTLSGTKVVVSETTQHIKLKKHLFTYTIYPTPENAFVVLMATGFVQSGNSIGVPYDTNVGVIVKAPNYYSEEFERTVYDDCSDEVTLDPGFYVDLTNYEYTDNDGDVVLTRYKGNEVKIEVPHKIDV